MNIQYKKRRIKKIRIRKNRKRKKRRLKMTIKILTKDNPNRWFLIQSNDSGEAGIICFGNGGEQGSSKVETGQPKLESYLTEPELESKVNEVVGDNEYYKNSVESGSEKFVGESGIYELILIEEEDDE